MASWTGLGDKTDAWTGNSFDISQHDKWADYESRRNPTGGAPLEDDDVEHIKDNNGDDWAATLNAEMQRANFYDYKNKYYQVEDDLASRYKGEHNDALLSRVQGLVDNQLNSTRGNYHRNLSRYGLDPSSRSTRANERSMAIDNAATKAATMNQARRAIGDEKQRIFFGSGS